MSQDRADRRIDVRGQICPYPAIAIKRALSGMGGQQVLEVLIDYEPTVATTLPAFCRRAGFRMAVARAGRASWKVRIEKPRSPGQGEGEECAS
jgi:tRNA 2-thiouridine synthesizing protein A